MLISKYAFIFLVSNPNRWSKEAIKTELKNRNISYDDKENKYELVTILQKNIGEETQKEIESIYNNTYLLVSILYFLLTKHYVGIQLQEQSNIPLVLAETLAPRSKSKKVHSKDHLEKNKLR